MLWQVHSNWTTTSWENRLGPVGLHGSSRAFNPLCNKYEGRCQEHHRLAQCSYTYGYVIEQLIYQWTIDKTESAHSTGLLCHFLCDLCALMNNPTAEHLTAVLTYQNWNGKWYSSGGLELWTSSLYGNDTVLTLPSLFTFTVQTRTKCDWTGFGSLSCLRLLLYVTCVRVLSSSWVGIISNGPIHLL